jgi:DNA topoisomerase VI subunit B
MGKATIKRQVFVVGRHLDFFSEDGLTAQVGYGRDWWPFILLKELLDNSLDGCESADIVPAIEIVVDEDSLTVSDRGPGLRAEIIEASLDYTVRVSDKANYSSPSRGQLGNALKLLWSIPFVCAEDQHGEVEVDSMGIHHKVEISGSSQDPHIIPTRTKSRVKIGTKVKVHWPGVSSVTDESETTTFYNVVQQFALLNPHTTFRLQEPDKELVTFEAAARDFRKWKPNDPTSPHWYDKDSFQNLVAAYVVNGQSEKSVREFVREFYGLRGSQYQQKVLERAKVSGKALGDLNERSMMALHAAMMELSREVPPRSLGVIGAEHFRKNLLTLGISEASFKYKKLLSSEDGMPFVFEAAFGVRKRRSDRRDLLMGLNFSPTFHVPSEYFGRVFRQAELDGDDPVVLCFHLVTPQLHFTSLGKGEIANETDVMREAISNALEYVTRDYTKTKKKAQRRESREIRQSDLDEHAEARTKKKEAAEEIKEAAYRVMPEAYAMASGGSLPANARQVMYAARKIILETPGAKLWASDSYFTQKLLPEFQKEYPEETQNWDVVYDARGHFREPHTGVRFGIGTLEVRKYVKAWTARYGPKNRFRNALFIEKEGFDQLVDASRITERFDLAFFSTKGMSVTSARSLIEALSVAKVATFVAHDFDFSGFNILHTTCHDTARYEFETLPNVVDLGLRLTDVQGMNLDPEPHRLYQKKDPRIRLREYGATAAEIDFMIGAKGRYGKGDYWECQRVELNAMTSVQIIEWLERKLVENGVHKFVPDADVLGPLWEDRERAAALEKFKNTHGDNVLDLEKQLAEAKSQLEEDFAGQYKAPRTPKDLREQVAEYLTANPLEPWDMAIASLPPRVA